MLILFMFTSLAGAAVPFDCPSALDDFLVSPQPAAVRTRVAVNRAVGQSWRTAVARRNEDVPDAAEFAADEFTLTGLIETPFAARVSASPGIEDDPSVIPITGMEARPRVFTLNLEATEVDRALGGRLPDATHTHGHLGESLGHLRYSREGNDFFVREIDSALYSNFSPDARARYRDWSRTLLLAFERFVEKTTDGAPWRVLVKRAVQLTPTLRTLPLTLGYHSVDRPNGRWYAYSSSQIAHTLNPARVTAGARISFVRSNRVHAASHELERRTPKPPTVRGAPRPDAYVAAIPFLRMPDALLYASPTERRTHERVRDTLPPWSTDFAKNSIVSLGRGRAFEANAQPLNLNKIDVRVDLPSVRPAEITRAGDPGTILVAGVGRRWLDPRQPPAIFTVTSTDPKFATVEGGLLESEGRAEFRRTLRLFDLAARARVPAFAARPIDLGWPVVLPRVDGPERRMVPSTVYLDDELRDAPERLVQLRTFVMSHVNVAYAPVVLDEAADRGALEATVREVYVAFDETFTPPALDAEVSFGEWVRRARAVNGPAAERITRRWMERTLGTIGLIHGAFGTLGDDAHLNNVSLAGELLSLRHLRFVRPRHSTAEMSPLWARDRAHWAESYHWMKQLLLGEDFDGDVQTADTYEGSVYRSAFDAGRALTE